jgi:hypothetical protein
MRWVGYVENLGKRESAYEVWGRNLREREHLEDPGFVGRLILK